jgi:hypothetical protein
MVNSSIEYSGLLITRTLQRYKHQLRDFFNTHACYQQLCWTGVNSGRRATRMRKPKNPEHIKQQLIGKLAAIVTTCDDAAGRSRSAHRLH